MKRLLAVGVLIGVLAAPAMAGRRTWKYDATIRCKGGHGYLNEDQAANLKLVKFALDEDGEQVIVLRCKRHGY